MVKETRDAIKHAVRRYRRISGLGDEALLNAHMGGTDCRLCTMFRQRGCGGCPVYERTGHTGCHDTPWHSAGPVPTRGTGIREFTTASRIYSLCSVGTSLQGLAKWHRGKRADKAMQIACANVRARVLAEAEFLESLLPNGRKDT